MKENIKAGEIVWIPDLKTRGQVLNTDRSPKILLRIVTPDKDELGTRRHAVMIRTTDQLEPIPESDREAAAIEFYQTQMELIAEFAGLKAISVQRYCANVSDPITVENRAQRYAGYLDAFVEMQRFIETMTNERMDRRFVFQWFAARDKGGELAIFDQRPKMKDEEWWSRTGELAIRHLQEGKLPGLKPGQCAPVLITVEMIVGDKL